MNMDIVLIVVVTIFFSFVLGAELTILLRAKPKYEYHDPWLKAQTREVMDRLRLLTPNEYDDVKMRMMVEETVRKGLHRKGSPKAEKTKAVSALTKR